MSPNDPDPGPTVDDDPGRPSVVPKAAETRAAEVRADEVLAGLRGSVGVGARPDGPATVVWAWLWPRLRARPGPWLALGAALVLLTGGVGAMAWATWHRDRSGEGSYQATSPIGSPSDTADPGGGALSEGSGSGGTSATTGGGLVVQVAGAVVHPGVYHLAAGSRVADLIVQAGGLVPDADGDRVNQAAALVDGTMIYVPRVGQVDLPDAGGGSGAVGGGSGGDAASGGSTPTAPVDLNTATATQLDSLPGVGPATANAILAYRRQHGPFHTVDDLAGVPGIGPAKLAQIRPHARV